MLRTFALHALAAAVLLSGGVAHAQLQTTAQQKCLINVTNAGLKVARAEGKQIRSCVRAAVRGDLLASDGLGCVTSDPRGKIQGARTKTLLAAARSCIVTPGFGFTGAPTVNTAAVDEDIALTVDIFGPSLVEAAILHVVNRDGASCQSKVQGAYEKLFTAKLRHFASCQKRGLSFAQISSGAELAECVEEVKLTTDVKIEKARAKLLSTIQRSCSGVVATRDAFPGRCDSALNSSGLSACLDQATDCRTCTMMAVSYALPIDCDEFDDGTANGSCIEGIHTTPTTLPPGEGACTNPEDEAVLSSVNIQTITRNCTLGCLTSETRQQCIALCIANQTGLGAECSLCYADSSECGIQNCAGPCALSQTSPACLSCLESTGCIAAFDECAGGVPVTTTTEPPPTTTMSTTTTTVEPGACANPADEAVDNAYDLQAETTACTLTCLSAGNLQQCVAACLAAETGLSSGCSSCYAGSAQCGLENCAAECAVNQSSPACLACLETNCVPGFDQCAFGTPTTTLDTTTTTIAPTTTTIGGGTTTTLPPMEGECTNPADEAVIQSVDIQTETRDCTLTCLSASDIAQCTADCLVNNIELSPGCALCYGESSECGIQFCAAQCAVNQNAPACIACLNANCIPAFDECAGTGTVTTTTIDTTTTTSTTTTTMPPTGACTNPPDVAVDNAYDLEAQSTTCMVSCLSAPNRPACVAACVSSATGLSSPCSSCYGQSAECGLQNCAGVCATNQSAPPCRACLEANCIPAFNECSGLGDPPAPATCTNLVQDGTETDIDCGGLCAPCPIGDSCTVGDDCISGECVSGTCVPPQTEIPLGSCVDGYIDPTTDADAIDLGGLPATGADDGYKVVLPSFTDVFIELTNLLNGTTELRAALVNTPSNPMTAVMSTGAVQPGQNGTAGPTGLTNGTRYLYVDSAVADTYGPYRICVLPAPTIALGQCITGNVGNGDGNNVQIAGPSGAGGDRGIRFIPAVDTNVRLRLRNVSGGSKMAAALFRNSTIVSNSETPDAILFTERTAGPAFVTGGDLYNVQVDLADADTFGTFELCLVQAGCGDGVKDGGEACDDGNNTNGDGCSSTCALESGKIVVDSCRTDFIPLFGSDCDDWTLPILENESVFVEVTNPAGGTLLARAELRLGGTLLSQSGNIPIGQTGSTAVTAVTAPNNYTARVCDVTGAGTGNYTVCVRSARRLDLGECFSSNVTDGDGNVINLAGPISGGDEDVIFQPPATTTVKLSMSHDGGGGLLASGIYNGQPGSLLPGSAVGQSPSPIPVGGSGTSGLVAVNGAQIYRVYTDIASLGTAGNNYTICVAEVEGDTCLNPEDEAVRAAYNLNAEAEAAGLSCTGNASCISSTLQNDTGLSSGCADCYGSVGGCAASNCALQCLGDSGSSGCRNCVTSNCAAEFEICSGWTYGQ